MKSDVSEWSWVNTDNSIVITVIHIYCCIIKVGSELVGNLSKHHTTAHIWERTSGMKGGGLI